MHWGPPQAFCISDDSEDVMNELSSIKLELAVDSIIYPNAGLK
jgi:hypothetical protein